MKLEQSLPDSKPDLKPDSKPDSKSIAEQLWALRAANAQLLVERKQHIQKEAALQQQIQQHEQTLRRLRTTQAQLIQTEKMSSLGQLVAGIAHEINNPINFIQGNLNPARHYIADLLELLHLYQNSFPQTPQIQAKQEAIDLEFLEADLPKLLNSIATGATRIHDIVRSLRTFSHLDEAETKTVDIHAGLDSALLMLKSRLKPRSNIQLIKEYGKLPQIECYPGRINQALMNILSNAVDALEEIAHSTYAGTRIPSLTIKTEVLNPDWIAISIGDNGLGISDEIQQQIFDPFFTTKPVGRGTGLGLSISYQIIVDRHRGHIDCISSPGQGSQFLIRLPVRLWS